MLRLQLEGWALLKGAERVGGGPQGVLGGRRVLENGVLTGTIIPRLNMFCSKRGRR